VSAIAATLRELGLRATIQRAPVTTEDPMPSDAADFVLRQSTSEDATFRVTCFDEDDARVDLTGATITFRVKNAITDVDAVIAKSVGSGITILDQSDPDGETYGQADIEVLRADVAALAAGVKVYEVVVTLDGNTASVVRPNPYVLSQGV
jgi:hypothetical protein